jgi:hypothetical protein
VFAQASPRLTAFSYIGTLLAEYDWKAALAALQRFIVAQLGDPEAIVVLDEIAALK